MAAQHSWLARRRNVSPTAIGRKLLVPFLLSALSCDQPGLEPFGKERREDRTWSVSVVSGDGIGACEMVVDDGGCLARRSRRAVGSPGVATPLESMALIALP